jgi:hypothetical protein
MIDISGDYIEVVMIYIYLPPASTLRVVTTVTMSCFVAEARLRGPMVAPWGKGERSASYDPKRTAAESLTSWRPTALDASEIRRRERIRPWL